LNDDYLGQLEDSGLKSSGINPKTGLVEIIELPENDWFIGVQFHPELKSKPFEPHPLFADFIRAAVERSKLIS
jgi:CTP synthase